MCKCFVCIRKRRIRRRAATARTVEFTFAVAGSFIGVDFFHMTHFGPFVLAIYFAWSMRPQPQGD